MQICRCHFQTFCVVFRLLSVCSSSGIHSFIPPLIQRVPVCACVFFSSSSLYCLDPCFGTRTMIAARRRYIRCFSEPTAWFDKQHGVKTKIMNGKQWYSDMKYGKHRTMEPGARIFSAFHGGKHHNSIMLMRWSVCGSASFHLVATDFDIYENVSHYFMVSIYNDSGEIS